MVLNFIQKKKMRRVCNLLLSIAEPDNIRFAAWKAAKGKRHSVEVLAWMQDMDKHIAVLRDDILKVQVRVGDYRFFKVFEPKERQICAASFDQQVLHHSLMNVCHPFFEQKQIFDSYASRKGKGTYAALKRAKWYNRHHTWFLKLDVKKFFDSISHDVLVLQLYKMFKDVALIGIYEQIIRSYEASPGRGLPIGNLTSQYFANHYLCSLDHFIKEKMGVSAYVRYMDDFVIWHQDKSFLINQLVEINNYMNIELRCSLKPPVLNRCDSGLPFLGYHLFPNHVRLLQKSKVRFARKLSKIENHFQAGIWTEEKCQRRSIPLIAFTRHAHANYLRESILLRLEGQSP